MRWLRPPIAGLMALVFATGLSLAAFRSLSGQAANATFVAMWAVLLAAVVASRYGRYRTFWAGFGIVGGGYALLAFAPGAASETRPYLATSVVLDEVAQRLELTKRPAWYRLGSLSGKVARTRTSPFSGLSGLDEAERYERIGHSVAAIVHGIAGGTLAVVIAVRARREFG
jgi:hypothetical protein